MPDELPEECCAKCRFAFDMHLYPDDAEHREGSCRRFPPKTVRPPRLEFEDWEQRKQLCLYPLVAEFDWCGEFQPRNDAKPPSTNATQTISDDTLIYHLGLSARVQACILHAIRDAGICTEPGAMTIGMLKQLRWSQFDSVKNCGVVMMRHIQEFCISNGISVYGMPSKEPTS